jgi:hypothetical protein
MMSCRSGNFCSGPLFKKAVQPLGRSVAYPVPKSRLGPAKRGAVEPHLMPEGSGLSAPFNQQYRRVSIFR